MRIVLTESERKTVWDKMIQSEVRSYYFASLASRYARQKQLLTGISFFLSSGAAATLVGKLPNYIAISLSIVAALIAAYSIAVSLDKRVIALSRLHTQWSQLCADYEHLWNHLDEEDAAQIYQELLERGRTASENGLDLPYDEKALNKWTNFVFSRLQTTG